jgi:putative ABC transport system permease protein
MIIEKNAQPISMTKILGYSNAEISRLYIVTTSVVTLLILAVTIPMENIIMKFIFMNYLAARMSGWITYDIPDAIFYKMFLIGAATYFVVAVFEMRKIHSIPMSDALKDVV